ncbi:helix-turn-helix domain-containing protein [Carboxydothermus ferrireducens]|uniref:Transcriptional regulator with XRE-family HTH domain n=1 Tax=Carboxydothermus ferrireducens DSM 11255 TaxID=1119529 RepID=A0ABX2R7J2_9THEO|nr:helix-turn-helix transcriptional regulator [Carboxydothermus ferrireducens]NYE57139.1 transcriptional regulator with XRE-family HTH domain [Carboxydothermus ferrireducens DSM 11255]
MNRRQVMVEMRAQGHTLSEIAKVFGLSRERVRQIISKKPKTKTVFVPLANENGVTLLKIERTIRGLTLRDLARLSGVSITVLTSLENRHRPVKELTASRIAETLGCPVEKIFKKEVRIIDTSGNRDTRTGKGNSVQSTQQDLLPRKRLACGSGELQAGSGNHLSAP